MFRRLRLFAHEVVTIVASGALAARGVGVWKPETNTLVVIAVWVIGIEALWQSTARNLHRLRIDRSWSFRQHASVIAANTFAKLVGTGLNADATGLSIMICPRPVLPLSALRRVARWPLGRPPATSRIRWTRGKGVVGRCWKEGQNLFIPTGDLYEENPTQKRREWRKLPREVRMRISHREIGRIRGKYLAVLAVPILDWANNVVGVMAVDVRKGSADLLQSDAVAAIVEESAEQIGAMVTASSRLYYSERP